MIFLIGTNNDDFDDAEYEVDQYSREESDEGPCEYEGSDLPDLDGGQVYFYRSANRRASNLLLHSFGS